ncbi:MAG: dUTP diphosphatase [Selenomonas ruminantium]|nr:dUTP diphosphatase [Selenomonas ruminantium]
MAVRGFEIVSAYEGKGIALPLRGTAASAGYDLSAAESVVIAPGEMAMVPTGVKAYMEPDEVLYIHIRSSLAVKRQLVLMNSVGVVDADYYNNPDNEGHIFIALWNRGKGAVTLKAGERLAQGVFMKYLLADGDTAGKGQDRQGGFGSTGK